jgi:hypothetical protein
MQRTGLAFLTVYAALGLALSLCVHVMSFFGAPPGGDGLFVALHVGIFPLWFCVIFIANRMAGGSLFGGGRRFAWKPLLDRAPPALRYMTIGFFIYAIFNFALFFLSIASQPHVPHAAAPPDVWRGFSGHWMAFYSAGLTIAATAYLKGIEPLGVRCPNGHIVGPDDAFCPRCGKPVTRAPARR